MAVTQLRIDPLSGLKVIVAPGRATRPGAFISDNAGARQAENCPFCEGHEQQTPPEIWALRPESSPVNEPDWQVRVVPNKYPLLGGSEAATSELESFADRAHRGEAELFVSGEIDGAHEVVVHTPKHLLTLGELSPRELRTAVETWCKRLNAHSDATYVQLIVNEGHRAGASLEHTHAQLYALPLVPIEVARERERFTAYADRTQGACVLCDLLQEEMHLRERVVAVDDGAVLLTPFASRLPYQLQIVPRSHEGNFATNGGLAVDMLYRAFALLRKTFGDSPPLNLWVHTAPRDTEHFHWHIEVVPRLAELAGLEMSTGLAANICAPERVASELGEVN